MDKSTAWYLGYFTEQNVTRSKYKLVCGQFQLVDPLPE